MKFDIVVIMTLSVMEVRLVGFKWWKNVRS